MKVKVGNFSIEWLLASHSTERSGDGDACVLQETKYNIPPEFGEAFLSRLELGEGIELFRAVHHMEKAPAGEMIALIDVHADHIEHAFNAQIWLSGVGCHHEYWNGRSESPIKVSASPGHDTFRFDRKMDATVQVGGGETSEMRAVHVPESTLLSLIGDSALNLLLEKLGLTEGRKAVVLPMPVYLNQSLREALSEQYAGPARRLFAQARVLEYLGGLVNFLYFSEEKKDRRHATKIRELCDYLLSLEGQLPTLSELSRTFGLSAKQLNSEFSAEFGQSIFAFVTAHRLEQAHRALLESDVPMKVLADRLGYSHVNHFNTAFRKKFGYPPGTLRKQYKLDPVDCV